MTRTTHRVYIALLAAIVAAAFFTLTFTGFSYYRLGLAERVDHPGHTLLKPGGTIGHGLGIIGTLSIITGVSSYMARKRYRFLSRTGLMKHWLEFHIFLCTFGPVLVLYHTAFKFGGLVSISFWSMVAVFLSGIIGRFIYLQIPRSIEGRELSLSEVRNMKTDIASAIRDTHKLDDEAFTMLLGSIKRVPGAYHSNPLVRYIISYFNDRSTIRSVNHMLRIAGLHKPDRKLIKDLLKDDIRLNRRIERLDTMQNLLRYWHVIHTPFALVMLLIMLVHVAVTIAFGYRWIF